MSLKERIQEDIKAAMKAGEKKRLGALRLITAAIKQMEVDRRIVLDDEQVIGVLDKMVKQRRESISHYQSAGRGDLVAAETYELNLIQAYLPQALSAEEIDALIRAAITETGAAGIQDLGKVMGRLKAKMQGRADLGSVSAEVRARLSRG